MTSRLAAVGRMAMRVASGVAIPGRSLMSMNALCGFVTIHACDRRTDTVATWQYRALHCILSRAINRGQSLFLRKSY